MFSILMGFNMKIVWDWLTNRNGKSTKSSCNFTEEACSNVIAKCDSILLEISKNSCNINSREFIKTSESVKRMDRAMEELIKKLIEQSSTTNLLLEQNKQANEKVANELLNNNTTVLTLLDRVVNGGKK